MIDQVDRLAPHQLCQPGGIVGRDPDRPRDIGHPGIARGDQHVEPRVGCVTGVSDKSPAECVLPTAGAHHEHAATHHQVPAAAAAAAGRRVPEATRPVRTMVWVRSGPTLTSEIGTPASSSSAST